MNRHKTFVVELSPLLGKKEYVKVRIKLAKGEEPWAAADKARMVARMPTATGKIMDLAGARKEANALFRKAGKLSSVIKGRMHWPTVVPE